MAIYLTEHDVAGLIDMPMALAAVEAAHLALARGEAIDVPRERVRAGRGTQHLLQAGWAARGATGYKVYTVAGGQVRFWVHLFDLATGAALAVIEANLLGMMRTGAAGGVAARRLARNDARVAGIIGAGWQARGQLLALAHVRQLERILVYARSADRVAAFCNAMQAELGVPVEAAASAQALAEAVDIVVTATNAPKPVLEGAWLRPGTHVNAMGSNSLARREIDEALVTRADLICVDTVDTALKEAGDLLPSLEKGRLAAGRLVPLGDVVAGFRPARANDAQITLFESQGLGIQDLSLGLDVLERARAAGIGQNLPY
ncbi:MAG: ornithine cyclodeaminase family protein [Rhodocyclaceae bacterium]